MLQKPFLEGFWNARFSPPDDGKTINSEIDELGYVRFIKEEGQTALRFHELVPSASQGMLTTNLAFVEWTWIFGSDRLTAALLTDSPNGVISKRRMGKIVECGRPGKDLVASIRQASNQGYTPE